ncbi:protein toll [Drosophila elegans]|uniref:protein toll n=1 Tax=Drosophila elegans TaxID=30023 RepID=UPI0007E89435|nr:protein toll [Drosophila elegans]
MKHSIKIEYYYLSVKTITLYDYGIFEYIVLCVGTGHWSLVTDCWASVTGPGAINWASCRPQMMMTIMSWGLIMVYGHVMTAKLSTLDSYICQHIEGRACNGRGVCNCPGSLQKSLEHLVLDINNEVDMKSLKNFAKLKLVKVRNYIPYEKLTALTCNQSWCNFIRGTNGIECPAVCDCRYIYEELELKINCSNRGLSLIPPLPTPIIGGVNLIFYNNSLSRLPNSTLAGYNTLKKLDVSRNTLTSLSINRLPTKLDYLDISFNKIILRYLDLRKNSLETLDDKVTRYLKEFKNISEVKLSGNPWNCDCKSRSILSFLRDNEALEYKLTLGRCNISRADCPDACVCCLDSSTSSSVIIDCNSEGLRRIPELSMKVTYVDLSNNNITAFTEKDRSFFAKRSLLSPLKLVLLNNPWSCTCKDIENINFMKSISSSIVDFTEISCSTGLKVVSIDQDVICPSGFAYYLALAISLAAVIVAINFMICFRQPLLVWFYEHNVCLSLAARRELDQAKKFDAFLAFTHKDEALVEEFVEKLELGKPRFRLCFYLRDWLVGESIPDCIGRSVRDSRRIIILMTDNFIRSTWGRLEFRLALHATSQDRCKRLIVVLYPDVRNFDSLDSELRAYMVFNTYLERSHPNFWNKLIYSMPHAKLRQGQPI